MHQTKLSYGSLSAKSILITIHSWINCPSYKINVTGTCMDLQNDQRTVMCYIAETLILPSSIHPIGQW